MTTQIKSQVAIFTLALYGRDDEDGVGVQLFTGQTLHQCCVDLAKFASSTMDRLPDQLSWAIETENYENLIQDYASWTCRRALICCSTVEIQQNLVEV